MTLLTPLGLLGLLGVLALIIIYIIRPNYQQKFISSTYVWKLSLSYRKKKIPINKLRNLLLILCQVLFLTTCAFILAQPNKILRSLIQEPEVVMIIDSSASMRTQLDGESRYTRAVEEVRLKAADTFDENGYVTVIIANEAPNYLMQTRMRANSRVALDNALAELILDNTQCSYASSNVDGAVALCETVLLQNPNAKVYLYSDNNYGYIPKTITYVNVSDTMEYNGAILDAKTEYHENKYEFSVDVACYGADAELNLVVDIEGANAKDSTETGSIFQFELPVLCMNGETTQALFISKEVYDANKDIYDSLYAPNIYLMAEGEEIASYQAIHVSLKNEAGEELEDSLLEDNSFEIYGGMKQVIKIQYASALPNSFWPAAIRNLRNVLSDRWDIQYTEVKRDTMPETSGFDLYIFEHYIPEKLPEDGVLWLMSPSELPVETGVKAGMDMQFGQSGEPLTAVATHPILENIVAEEITVSYAKMFMLDDSYEPLLVLDEFPMLAVRNDEDMKIVLTAFNLHFSNLAVLVEFPTLVYNMFSYFFPTTVRGNAFDVNEKVELNSMSGALEILGYDYHEKYTQFPATFVTDTPGTYTIKQTNFAGREFREKIYVRMPKEESDVFRDVESVAELYVVIDKDEFFEDFLFYMAIILVSVAFIEWWLRNHKNA